MVSDPPRRRSVLKWISDPDPPPSASKRDIAKGLRLKGWADRPQCASCRGARGRRPSGEARGAAIATPTGCLGAILAGDGAGMPTAISSRGPSSGRGRGPSPGGPSLIPEGRAIRPLGAGRRILARLTRSRARICPLMRRGSFARSGPIRLEESSGCSARIGKAGGSCGGEGFHQGMTGRGRGTIGGGTAELVEDRTGGTQGAAGPAAGRGSWARLAGPVGGAGVSLIAIHQHGIPDRYSDRLCR